MAQTEDTRTDAQRAAAAFRELADFLDANPDLIGTRHAFNDIMVFPRDRDGVVAWARAAARFKPAAVSKTHGEVWSRVNLGFGGTGEYPPVRVRVTIEREEVCERVVTGIREVTEMVPDPDHVAAAPLVEVTKTIEDVEWVCHPLLADPAPEQVAAAALTPDALDEVSA